MFTRPRCRKFEPLISAQLRLRNLIKISGLNFHCDDKKFSLYYTLHLSAFSKPFYTSEKVQCRKNIEWPEINSTQIQISSQKFICIRVWRQLNKSCANSNSESQPDKMLFLWGVYFSGLVQISNRNDIKFKENTLLFHLYGGTFTSPDQIVFHSLHSIPGSQSNCDQNSDKFSRSNFSVTNGSSNNLSPDMVASTPPRSLDSITSSNGCANVMDLMSELKYLKVRYIQLDFPKNEVQSSYTIEKLLQLQDIQRRIKLKEENSKLLADRICMKSAACLNLELILSKPVFFEPQKQPGMGRTLSKYLSQQQAPPKPEVVLRVHDLRLKVECARFRIKLLAQERDRSRHYNKSLELKREKLKDENTEKETMIWNSVRTLSRESLKSQQDKLAQQREVIATVKLALGETRRCLLREINEVYIIKRNVKGQYSINEIHLPDAESYSETTSTPTDISIALGYVAHAVLIVSRILNIPLRNQIQLDGSRTRIVDNIKVLPATDRV
jgi:UV radiation resistance-associated gene protein